MQDKQKIISVFRDLFRIRFPYFLISLFVAFNTVYLYHLSFSSELSSFSGRMLGICTLENFDAGSRTSFFYNSIFIILIVFFGFNAIINSLQQKNRFHDFEAIPLSWISLIGISGFIMSVTISTGLTVTELALLAFAPFIVLTILRQSLKRNPCDSLKSTDLFLWTFMISAIAASLFVFLTSVSGINVSFSIVLVIMFGLISILAYVLKISTARFNKLAYILKPLAWLPLLIAVSAEAAMILNQRQNPFAGSLIIVFAAIIILMIFVVKRTVKAGKTDVKLNHFRGYYIALIGGFAAIVFWQPAMNSVNELFEIANPSNALMRIYSFKELPLLQFMNSHLFSEIIPGFIYFLLNCYDGSIAFINYNFIEFIFVLIIIFLFIGKSIGNYNIAFLLCLFLPFMSEITDEATSLSLLVVIMLAYVYKKPVLKNTILFWLGLFGLILYSPDIATSAVAALAFTALFTPGFLRLVPFKNIIRSFALTAISVVVVIVAIMIITGIPLIGNIHQALLYLTAGQSHGATDVLMLFNRNSIAEYIVIPFTILVFLIYLIYKRKEISGSNNFLYTGLLFMIVFYFVNFQRGLLRHGFNEGHDGFLATFSFLILSISPYVLMKGKKINKHLVFILSSFILIWVFKYPEPSGSKPLFESTAETSFAKFQISAGQKKISRIISTDQAFDKNVNEFRNFCNKHIAKGQTFGDLSNSPMLYYYCQKPVPSYFCQGIQNVVTDKQQEYMLEDLKKSDMPYYVVSNVPPTWFDATDNVPNFLRYYRIAEYLFNNYRPWKIIGGHSVWVRNDIVPPNTIYQHDTVAQKPAVYFMGYLPAVWAKYERDHELNSQKTFMPKDFTVHNEVNFTVFIDSTYASPAGNYVDLEINYTGKGNPEYILDYGSDWVVFGEFHFKVNFKSSKYRIRVSTQYQWYNKKINFVRIRPTGEEKGAELLSVKFCKAD